MQVVSHCEQQVVQGELPLAELYCQQLQTAGVDLRRPVLGALLQQPGGVLHGVCQGGAFHFRSSLRRRLENFDHVLAVVVVEGIGLVQGLALDLQDAGNATE